MRRCIIDSVQMPIAPRNCVIIIIIMEICKAPSLRLKELTKHNVIHIMYIEMENVISNLTQLKKLTHNVDISVQA